jgi:hypothetical protein
MEADIESEESRKEDIMEDRSTKREVAVVEAPICSLNPKTQT